ncbi:transcriptional regulator, TetR family [Paenibacillus curdlanolyticus YK9]|uniref:Transcriptional regulator, TetR family n=1 Tax=Paenibacillus curdlanolyticus YK9 TaxID=717606 RepID=E0IBD7_9BACL|nr:TetR/AcrR family transcriptional regulator [Paenibacillus curdlanolyticus]EFM10017.1 transcriptional regulator, TetR family [Paenibacillus curdlanolyticus YK9]
MDPRARYEKEIQTTRHNRTRHIIEAAERVFTIKGIENTTMQDVAREANLGVATVFRFFPRKDKLIVAVVTSNLQQVLHAFQSIAAMSVSCLDKIELLFDHSISLLHNQDSSNVKLMENFENYAAHYTEPLEDIEAFNAVYREISSVFSSVITQGVQDGSIRPDLPIPETLTTVMNTFSMFARKLSLQKNILLFEQDVPPENQLAILKQILMSYLRN